MAKLLYLLPIVLALLMGDQTSHAAYSKYCESDWECPPHYYCFSDSKMCSPCTDCSVFHRNESRLKSCVKEPKECGPCLPGFEEEILTGGKRRDVCILIVVPTSWEKSYDHKDGISSMSLLSLSGGLLMVVLLAVTIHFRNRRFTRATAVSQNSIDEEHGSCHISLKESPPPYAIKQNYSIPSPSAPSLQLTQDHSDSPDQSTEMHSKPIQHIRHKQEAKQTAVPFARPSYGDEENHMDEFDYVTEESLNENIQDETGALSLLHNYEDENTMPSDWRPQYPRDICRGSQSEIDSDSSEEGPSQKRQRTSMFNINLQQTTINFLCQNQNINP